MMYERCMFAVLEQILKNQEDQRTTNQQQYGAIMAQIDDLNTALASISNEVANVATEQNTLIAALQKANESPAVDLSGPIANAQAILAKLQGIDDLVPATPVSTDPTPTATA